MNQNTNTNYLTNSLTEAGRFVHSIGEQLRSSIYQSPYGYGSNKQSVLKNLGTIISNPAKTTAAAIGDVLTNASLKDVWKYTNIPRMAGDVGKAISSKTGLDPITGAVLTALVPATLASLSNTRGPISQGLRPVGYKAVAPVSKEEDPSGKTPQSIPLEIALRYGLGQRSQLLPYQDFKQERPDVHPSTYVQYRRYQQSKPPAGQLVSIDPEGQSFTTVGGLVRGTAKGLNDPEVRIKGFPITLSSALGTAAGAATLVAGYNALPEDIKKSRIMQGTAYGPEVTAERSVLKSKLDPLLAKQNQLEKIVQRISNEMKSKNIPKLQTYGPDPEEGLPSLKLHQEALHMKAKIGKVDTQINEHKYALGRATGEIPAPVNDPGVETMMSELGVESTKTGRNAREMKSRVEAKIQNSISFSDNPENIKNLKSKLDKLQGERSSLIGNVKQRLEALNLPPESLSLQDRLSRAQQKLSDVGTKATDVSTELRGTYRPTKIATPSISTIAGLAIAGTAAATGTALIARKLMEKSAERRIKKENPVEYLKHKHGSLEQASAALGQPQAQSWQQLVPLVK